MESQVEGRTARRLKLARFPSDTTGDELLHELKLYARSKGREVLCVGEERVDGNRHWVYYRYRHLRSTPLDS